MSHTYEYPRPALTVDGVVFSEGCNGLRVLLIKRAGDPFKGSWAIPGGFVDMDETAGDAVRRELEEETGLKVESFKQFHTFTAVDRDSRHRVVSVAFWAFVTETEVHAGSDASLAEWVDVNDLPALAFDHDEILSMAIQEFRIEFGWIDERDEHNPLDTAPPPPARKGGTTDDLQCDYDTDRSDPLGGDDPIRPAHYTSLGIEPILVIEAWELGFCLGNTVKYISRAPHKGRELEDLKKANWYLDRRIEQLEKM